MLPSPQFVVAMWAPWCYSHRMCIWCKHFAESATTSTWAQGRGTKLLTLFVSSVWRPPFFLQPNQKCTMHILIHIWNQYHQYNPIFQGPLVMQFHATPPLWCPCVHDSIRFHCGFLSLALHLVTSSETVVQVGRMLEVDTSSTPS